MSSFSMVNEKEISVLENLRKQPVQNKLSSVTEPRYFDRVEAAARRSPISRTDLERILGKNDLVHISYLRMGLRAADSVARIRHAYPNGGSLGIATGFLVSPQLLLTNHHVLPSMESARELQAEFGYELDPDGTPSPSTSFALEPERCYFSNQQLDYALVAVAPRSVDGRTQLARHGWLRLETSTMGVLQGEFVTLIQHPGGNFKQVALRENDVLQVGNLLPGANRETRIWYRSDTAPGSSGSPVFNDSWQVVALHSSGVPEREPDGRVRLRDGRLVSDAEAQQLPEGLMPWIANEGILVSSILKDLARQVRDKPDALVSALLEDAARDGSPFGGYFLREETSNKPAGNITESIEGRPNLSSRDLSGREGYRPSFLGMKYLIPLPDTTQAEQRFGPATKLKGSNEVELKYQNFSILMSQKRRLAFFTAVNIDGQSWVNLPRKPEPAWLSDPRLPEEFQVLDAFYQDGPQGFDRGHLVRRMDPCWGADARRANADTFYFTNCTPQYYTFNQSQSWWQGLENHILYSTDALDWRANVFTGPVFQESDPLHRGVQIPEAYWKVVACRKPDGNLLAAGFLVSQRTFLDRMEFEALPVDDFKGYQVPLTRIEELTGLTFAENVRSADVSKQHGVPLSGNRIRWYHEIRL